MKDAPFMLEWMHEESVVKYLHTNFSEKTIEDCYAFITDAKQNKYNFHLAVADENDEYMGTASLKNISNGTAEFAITIRPCAMGKGYSKFAMEYIIEKGFNELKLSSIYWCVSRENERAIRFYDKNGYRKVSPETLNIKGNYSASQIGNYLWYSVTREQ